MVTVKIGATKKAQAPFLLEFMQPMHGLKPVTQIIVPPVKLHQIEPLHAQSRSGSIDGFLQLGACQAGKLIQIGHAFWYAHE